MNKIIKSLLLIWVIVLGHYAVVAQAEKVYTRYTFEAPTMLYPEDMLEFTADELHAATYKFSDQFLDQSSFEKMAVLRKAAVLNGHVSQSLLGDLYFDGTLVEQDFHLAIRWYQLAASNGSAYAKYLISVLYKYGMILPQDINLAVAWERSGNRALDSRTGIFRMAERFLDLDSPLYNVDRAEHWYLRAAKHGDLKAQTKLAELYYTDVGDESDLKALRWNSLAAYNGSAEGQFNLAKMYFNGRVLDENLDYAFYWMSKSAQAGYRPAQYELGMMFLEGRGVTKNAILAYAWLMAANPELAKYRSVNAMIIKATEKIPQGMNEAEMETAARLAYQFQRKYRFHQSL